MISSFLSSVFGERVKTDLFINNKNELAYCAGEDGSLQIIKHINIYHLLNLAKNHLIKKENCEIDIHMDCSGDVVCIITKLGLKGRSFKGKYKNEYQAFFSAYEKYAQRQKVGDDE